MLRKLIKYDLKALSRVLIFAQLPIVPLTLMIQFMILPEIYKNGIDFVLVAGAAAYFLYITVAATLTSLYIAVYTYKNLFSDQGYLTLTLPASPMQHLLSKIISGMVWVSIDCLVIMLSLVVIANTPEITYFFGTEAGHELAAEFSKSMGGMGLKEFFLWLSALEVLGIISCPILLLGSICFGQLFANHRILWAVIGYTLLSMISGLFGAGYSFRATYQQIGTSNNGQAAMQTMPYFNDLLLFTAILSIIACIFCFLLSYWVLKKKINLH